MTKISVIVVISLRQLSTRQLTGLVLLGSYIIIFVCNRWLKNLEILKEAM